MSSTALPTRASFPPAAPAPRYRFVALGVVWSAYLIVFLSRLCVGPLSPFLKESFDLSNAQIGGLTSATAVAYAPTLIFAGWLADRIGVRRALLIGTLITGVCTGAVALAPSYGVMLVLLACSGFGCGFIYPAAVKAIMVWFPARERATAVGVNQAAVNVSGMLWLALLLLGVGAVGWGGLLGTLAGETAGHAAAGAAAGVTAAIDNVGIFIGPPLFGLIVDRTGSYAPAWWAMVAAAAAAAVLLALVREQHRDRPRAPRRPS